MNVIYCRLIQPANKMILSKRFIVPVNVSNGYINDKINKCHRYADKNNIKIDMVFIDEGVEDNLDRKVYKEFLAVKDNIEHLIAITISDEEKGIVGNLDLYSLFTHKNIKLKILENDNGVKYLMHFYDK